MRRSCVVVDVCPDGKECPPENQFGMNQLVKSVISFAATISVILILPQIILIDVCTIKTVITDIAVTAAGAKNIFKSFLGSFQTIR